MKIYILTSEPNQYQGETNIEGCFTTYAKAKKHLLKKFENEELEFEEIDKYYFETETMDYRIIIDELL